MAKNIQETGISKRFFFLIVFFGAILVSVAAAWFSIGRHLIGIDDANIFFSYAQNLVNGRGITYAGNGVPVEGCTSLAWLLICSFNFLFGFNEIGVFICSLVCLAVAQLCWLKVLEKVIMYYAPQNGRAGRVVYAGLIISCPAYITWMGLTLMDSALWGMVLSCMAYVLVSEMMGNDVVSRWEGMLPFVISTIVRPEAMFVAPVSLLMIATSRILRKQKVVPVLTLSVAFVLTLAGLTLFRMLYFGFPLPNTYYAKVSPSLIYNLKCGILYAGLYVSAGIPVSVFACASLFMPLKVPALIRNAIAQKDTRPMAFLALWIWVVFMMAVPVLNGGDHFEMHRFFQPLYPGIAVLLAGVVVRLNLEEAVSRWIGDKTRFLVLPILVSALVLSGWTGRDSWLFSLLERSPLRGEFELAQNDYKEGELLNCLFEGVVDFPVVGTITAGGISRSYRGGLVDLMGLNDVRIAHHPGDRRGVKNHAAFSPAVFSRLGVDILRTDPCAGSDYYLKGMCGTPEFARDWRYGELSRKDIDAKVVALFAKKWLENVLKTGHYSFYDKMVWDCEKTRWRSP